MMRGKAPRLVVMCGLMAVGLVGTACGGDDEGGGATGGGATGGGATGGGATGGGATADLVTSGSAFDPTTVTVSAGGDTITITNEDGIAHTFTLDDGSVDEPLPGGETVTVDVDVSEDTPFHCNIHPAMTGTLAVA